jgi:hypothetical protein
VEVTADFPFANPVPNLQHVHTNVCRGTRGLGWWTVVLPEKWKTVAAGGSTNKSASLAGWLAAAELQIGGRRL